MQLEIIEGTPEELAQYFLLRQDGENTWTEAQLRDSEEAERQLEEELAKIEGR